MQIDIQARHLAKTGALRQYSGRRIRFSLARFENHIHKISMWLSDVNGPRGGRDKHCRLQISLAGNTDVIVEDRQVSLQAAINRALDRAGRSLARKLKRQQDRLQRNRNALMESPGPA